MSIRLINTSTLQLETYDSSDIPKYAILSHTWNHGEEADYQGMVSILADTAHPLRKKSGFQKIRDTCQKAHDHGIKYAWVDTCCINKQDPNELSEAINSMFKWYKRAQVCYVYLTDMEPGPDIGRSMSGCRWFTRGWCLQELLAPSDLRFYNKDWQYQGDKISLKRAVSRISKIGEDVLGGEESLQFVPVARKMSWAAKRNTSKVEDMAYCLMGIFDVNMPLLYGEGKKSFFRLQEEIMKQSSDLSIFTPLSSSMKGTEGYSDLLPPDSEAYQWCGRLVNLTAESKVLESSSFMMTNQGVYFRKAELYTECQYGWYWMHLHCKMRPETSRLCIFLRKVGPNKFVRIAPTPEDIRHMDKGRPSLAGIRQDAYLITKLNPSIIPMLQLASKDYVRIHIEGFDKGAKFGGTFQQPFPADRWDASGSKFLTAGLDSFWGRARIYPYLASTSMSHLDPVQREGLKEIEYFMLTCSLETDKTGTLQPKLEMVSYEDCEKREKSSGEIFRKPNGGESGKLILGTSLVTALMAKEGTGWCITVKFKLINSATANFLKLG